MTFQAAVMLEVVKIHQHTLPFSTAVTTLLSEALKPKHLFCPYHCFFLLFYKNQMEDYSVIINQAHSVLRAAWEREGAVEMLRWVGFLRCQR